MGVLDFIFPKYCVNCKKPGSYLCANCFSYISFSEQNTKEGFFSAIAYKGVVRKLIFQFKYKPYLSDLRTVLGELFYESLIQQEEFMKILETNPILVPIPLHKSKLQKRGYNHAQILAEDLAKRLDLSHVDLLKRIKKTSSQFGLKKEERKKNVAGAFEVVSNALMSQFTNIVLVDDILTTGATMLEATRVLKKAGVKRVWGLALARD
ncbi:MAG: ComF family protein [Candidatus Levybacteria bacterium]|nr:ComF family protein [Candidatus Levybacteria bacterium]